MEFGLKFSASGGVIMAGAYLGWWLFERFGIDPYLSIPIVLIVSFALGVIMYQGLVRWLPRGAAGGPASLLLLFGVWLVLRKSVFDPSLRVLFQPLPEEERLAPMAVTLCVAALLLVLAFGGVALVV